jgi:hypothetical protein
MCSVSYSATNTEHVTLLYLLLPVQMVAMAVKAMYKTAPQFVDGTEILINILFFKLHE